MAMYACLSLQIKSVVSMQFQSPPNMATPVGPNQSPWPLGPALGTPTLAPFSNCNSLLEYQNLT